MDIAIQASAASRLQPEHDDDLCDRLLRKYTFVILVGFAVLTTFQGYWGERIACAVEFDISDNSDYVTVMENLCYMNNTYRYVESEYEASDSDEYIRNNMITYYQWTPIICVLSIMLILFPSFIWNSCAPSYRKITEIPRNYSFINSPNQQEQLFKKASLIVRNVIAHTSSPHRLAYIYLSTKVISIAVLLLNIALFALPINTINIFKLWRTDQNYISVSSKFPILVKCDVKMPAMSEKGYNFYSALCVLPNNILHFYFFAFCLHWFIFLLIICILNLIYWSILLNNEKAQAKYILSHLHCVVEPKDLHGFAKTLGPDGVFMVVMTSKNGSDLFASTLTEKLLTMYLQNKLDIEQ